MKRSLILIVLSCGIPVGTGCGAVAKRAFKEMRGASSHSQEVPGTIHGSFGRFKGASISSPHTNLGDLISSDFLMSLPGALQTYLSEKENPPFPGGDPILQIESEVMWYHNASGLKEVLGSDSFAVVLFRLKEDGKLVGKVQLVTKSAASRTNGDDMAKSMAKGLAKWFRKRLK